MPIEIKELIIKATVASGDDQESGLSREGAGVEPPGNQEEQLIKRCVEQVMEILRIQNER